MKQQLLLLLYLCTCFSGHAQSNAAFPDYHLSAVRKTNPGFFVYSSITPLYTYHPETILRYHNGNCCWQIHTEAYSAGNGHKNEQLPAGVLGEELANIMDINFGSFIKPSDFEEIDRERSPNSLSNYLKPTFTFRVGVNICFGKLGRSVKGNSTNDALHYQSQFRDWISNRPR